jgi:hypothetical protein
MELVIKNERGRHEKMSKLQAAVYDRRLLDMESFHLHVMCTSIGAMNFH